MVHAKSNIMYTYIHTVVVLYVLHSLPSCQALVMRSDRRRHPVTPVLVRVLLYAPMRPIIMC